MKIVIIPIVAITAAFVAGSASAHNAPMGWRYDGFCCNGDGHNGDCQQIPTQSVKVVKGGYEITLNPGDHRLVTKPHTFFVDQRNVRDSGDDYFHACLYPTEDTMRCFYAPKPVY